MSGGHYDYKCFEVTRFADLVEMTIKERSVRKETQITPEWTEVIQPLPAELLEKLRVFVAIMKACGDMAKDIEWCMSGDTGEETLVKDLDKEFRKIGNLIWHYQSGLLNESEIERCMR